MATKRTERAIPDAWRESVARHLAAWAEKQPKGRRTTRALGGALGLSGFTYTKLKNKNGPLGLHVLISLRNALHVSLDELLDLPPLPRVKGDARPVSFDEMKAAMSEVLDERLPTATPISNRGRRHPE